MCVCVCVWHRSIDSLLWASFHLLSLSGDLLPVSFSSVAVVVCVHCVSRTW